VVNRIGFDVKNFVGVRPRGVSRTPVNPRLKQGEKNPDGLTCQRKFYENFGDGFAQLMGLRHRRARHFEGRLTRVIRAGTAAKLQDEGLLKIDEILQPFLT
jgi:hypothetical protein